MKYNIDGYHGDVVYSIGWTEMELTDVDLTVLLKVTQKVVNLNGFIVRI